MCYCFLVANPLVCLCFLPEHSLFPVLSRAAIRILQKLSFPSLACNSRCAKGKLCEINCVPQNNWKPWLWEFLPRGPACPTLSSLLTQFPSLWSTSEIRHFFWNWEFGKMLKQQSPATRQWAQHRRPLQPWDLPAVLSLGLHSASLPQRPGLSAPQSVSPNGLFFVGTPKLAFWPAHPS